mgnify:CR=1 FL=1
MITARHSVFSRIGQKIQQKLAKLSIQSDTDLILHLPLRYEDETNLCLINDVVDGHIFQVEGEVIHNEIIYRPRKQLIVQINDSSGTLLIRFFNFYLNQVNAYSVGVRIRVLGEVRRGFWGIEMVHPKCRIVQNETPLADTLTPIYSTIAGLSQASIRKWIQQTLVQMNHWGGLCEVLPSKILLRYQLLEFKASLLLLHRPPAGVSITSLQARRHPAWRRIKFDELLAQQLSMRLHYQQRRNNNAPALTPKQSLIDQLLCALSFRLTAAQEKVLTEIFQDLAAQQPMQRLLQGDVGSGKTIVSALAALRAIENGYQVAIMAPTEILAEQHYGRFTSWLAPLNIEVAWLSGSQTKKQREKELARISAGKAMLAVGTHALFQDQVVFSRLGLVVIDEQHRFGVAQRLALRHKGDKKALVPHQLMMSATPIPRTLAMSYYADLDVSIIDQLPPGRAPIITKLIDNSRRAEVTQRVREACDAGKQIYWVCPLIEESAVLELKTAIETYEILSQHFPDIRVGLIHGKLNALEKSSIMADFSKGDIQLLVATTVIEVGVDVPNASWMIIEHAERLGLSQLHQLRGRIGRGQEASLCILLYQKPLSKIARERLRIIFEHTDGFEIAQRDLRLRGPGELLGTRQSGVPLLRFANLEEDTDLLEAACDVAEQLLAEDPKVVEFYLTWWLASKNALLQV